jgi:site-specific DNA recombinase
VKKTGQARQTRQAIGYIRVSTQQQAENGVSLDTQRTKIKQWCTLHEYKLATIFEDAGISGTREDRPGLDAARAACTKGTALVVYKLDRLGRSTINVLKLGKEIGSKGADLVSISENLDSTTPGGRFMFHVFAALAQLERDTIVQRISDNLQQKIANGERAGEIPYGKKLKLEEVTDPRTGKTRTLKLLKPDKHEQAIVERVRRLRKRGLSLRKIAGKLTEERFRPRGSRWYAQTVANILGANHNILGVNHA